MFDDGSSLTDVSSSESDFTPSNPKKGPKKRGDYVLKGVLKAPRTSTYAAKALYGEWHCSSKEPLCEQGRLIHRISDQIIESNIDLDPEYQRGMWAHSHYQRRAQKRFGGLSLAISPCADSCHLSFAFESIVTGWQRYWWLTPIRCCLAWGETDWTHRLDLAKLLHSPSYIRCVSFTQASLSISFHGAQLYRYPMTAPKRGHVLMGSNGWLQYKSKLCSSPLRSTVLTIYAGSWTALWVSFRRCLISVPVRLNDGVCL